MRGKPKGKPKGAPKGKAKAKGKACAKGKAKAKAKSKAKAKGKKQRTVLKAGRSAGVLSPEDGEEEEQEQDDVVEPEEPAVRKRPAARCAPKVRVRKPDIEVAVEGPAAGGPDSMLPAGDMGPPRRRLRNGATALEGLEESQV